MRSTLVLGIGNILLRDEGVGVRAVEILQRMDLPEGVQVIDGGTSGADLIEHLADRSKVVVIDAVEGEGLPGTIYRLRRDDLMCSSRGSISLHQIGLVESLTMARFLGCDPQEVIVFGVQPGSISPGLELTPEVVSAVPKIVEAVLEEIS